MPLPRLTASLNAMTSTAAPIPLRPPLTEAEALLRRVRIWPYVRVDVRGNQAAIYSGLPETCVASLNLETDALTVFVGAEEGTPLVEAEPLLRRTSEGVHLGVHDTGSRTAGERALRWRIDLERFGPQLRAASP
jgi:hypothetical protein